MNTFLTSYQKNKGGISIRSSNPPNAVGNSIAHEVIKEAAADSSGVSNTVVGEGESF
jgi:Cyclin